MADLTDEMKEFLNSNLAWVATISTKKARLISDRK